MLEFVNVTGPEAGKDESTRRKVRSQAMKDFRRRQRAENERKKSLPPSCEDNHRTGSRTGRQAQSCCGLKEKSQCATIDLAYSTTQSKCVSRTDNPSTRPRALAYDNLATASHSLGPPTYGDYDLLESQAHMKQMFDYCKSYLSWLCPDLDSTQAAEVLAARREAELCPAVLAALCLASVGHVDATRGRNTSIEYALYKARVFRNINERMKASADAVSDETIGYLACLLSYEMSNCSSESILHLKGLDSIIQLKGGLDTFSPPLAMMLECLDICHALMFNTEPVLTATDITMMSNLDNRLALLRLLCNEIDEYQQSIYYDHAYREQVKYIPQFLQDAMAMTRFLCQTPQHWETKKSPEEYAKPYRRRLELARTMYMRQDAHPLANMMYQRIQLDFNIDVLRMHPYHPLNQSIIDSLWHSLHEVSELAWTPFAYYRIWILIAGATSARESSKKSFFKAHLVRCIFRMGVSEWHRCKTFIVRYLSSRVLEKAVIPGAVSAFNTRSLYCVPSLEMRGGLDYISDDQLQADIPTSSGTFLLRDMSFQGSTQERSQAFRMTFEGHQQHRLYDHWSI